MQSLRRIWLLSHATFLEGVRHRALWGIIGLAVVFAMANMTVTTLFSWDLGKVSIEFGLSAVAFTGLLLVFFLGMKILADDLERSRIYMILSRPVSLWEYLLGKYCGLALVLLFSTVILGLSAACSMQFVLWNYPGFVPPGFSWLIFAMALVVQWLGLLVVLAMSFFWFSFASQSFIAILLTAVSYLVGQNMELLRRVVNQSTQAGVMTDQQGIVTVISWIFPNLSLFDKKYEAAYGLAFNFSEFCAISVYGLSYSLLLLWFSTLLFKRKEFL